MSRYSISYSISIRRKRLPVKILNNLGFKSLKAKLSRVRHLVIFNAVHT